ncbi:MAG: nicotinate-nucleotide adenylyltransferase [Clostridia bacterium]|nr:nicotinate-nucleotide adenylyltransferase [Clostridia bacterium]
MRIGIFGGTFNPPHQGHKKLALDFMSRLSLDLMLVVPTYTPPHKAAPDLASGEDRLNMCKLCFNENFFKVSDIELLRKGKSYTVNTLQELKEKYPDDELFFIMGSDMLLTFHQWREPEEILNLATVCAAEREEGLTAGLHDYVDEKYSHRKDRFIILEFSPVEVSSTQIRESLGKTADENLISDEVENYIQERGLYRNDLE